jgi:hypothetical protein
MPTPTLVSAYSGNYSSYTLAFSAPTLTNSSGTIYDFGVTVTSAGVAGAVSVYGTLRYSSYDAGAGNVILKL